MKKFIITTDTTCDLPIEYLEKHNIKILPLYYSFNDIVFGDEEHLQAGEFYNLMRKGEMPVTMAANPDVARKLFIDLINQGYDILHIAFSSALSGSYNAAAITARDLLEEYPTSKIIVIDSLSASLGEGLLVHMAQALNEAGKSIDDVAAWVEENKLKINHLFTVDDLFHLHRGGRVSKATAIIGTLISVKPILHVNKLGQLIPLNNTRGRKKALHALVDEMDRRLDGCSFDNKTVFISHGDCLEDANIVAELVKERFNIDDILINYVSPTIGAHSGPGTVALFFFANER